MYPYHSTWKHFPSTVTQKVHGQRWSYYTYVERNILYWDLLRWYWSEILSAGVLEAVGICVRPVSSYPVRPVSLFLERAGMQGFRGYGCPRHPIRSLSAVLWLTTELTPKQNFIVIISTEHGIIPRPKDEGSWHQRFQGLRSETMCRGRSGKRIELAGKYTHKDCWKWTCKPVLV